MHASMKPNPNVIDNFLPLNGRRAAQLRGPCAPCNRTRCKPPQRAHAIAITAAFRIKEIRVFDHADRNKRDVTRVAMHYRYLR
jgi:hypothetical protein